MKSLKRFLCSSMLVTTIFLAFANIIASEQCCNIKPYRTSCLEGRIDCIKDVLLYCDKGDDLIDLLNNEKEKIPKDPFFEPYAEYMYEKISKFHSFNESRKNYNKIYSHVPNVYLLRENKYKKNDSCNQTPIKALPDLQPLPTDSLFALRNDDRAFSLHKNVILTCLTIEANVLEHIFHIPTSMEEPEVSLTTKITENAAWSLNMILKRTIGANILTVITEDRPTEELQNFLATRIDAIEEHLTVNEHIGDILIDLLKAMGNWGPCIKNRIDKLITINPKQ